MSFAGLGILIPGAGDLARRCAALVRERGGDAFVSPVLEFRPPEGETLARLTDALARLRNGGYDWLVVTSPRAVGALRGAGGVEIGPGTRVAAVGGATALALADAGIAADFVPDAQSAAGLVAEWPGAGEGREAAPGRVLLPHSDLAHTTVAEGLRARGYDVDPVVAYRTLPAPLTAEASRALAAGRIRAVLLTSGSAGRAVADELRAHPEAAIVSIGAQTTADLRAAGLPVAAESQQPTAESLLDAAARAAGTPPTSPPTSPQELA